MRIAVDLRQRVEWKETAVFSIGMEGERCLGPPTLPIWRCSVEAGDVKLASARCLVDHLLG